MAGRRSSLSRRALLRLLAATGVGWNATLAACAGGRTAITYTPASSASRAVTTTATQSSTATGAAPSPTAAGTRQAVTLTFLCRGDQGEQQVVEQQLTRFQQEQPTIKVTLDWPASGLAPFLGKLTTMVAAGTPPDLYWSHVDYTADVAAQQIPLPLDPLVASDNRFQLDAFFPASVNDFRVQGQLTGLPQLTTSTVLFYNRTLFQKSGVAQPTERWTWDTFLNAAGRLTTGSGPAKQWGTDHFTSTSWVEILTWQNGGDVINADRTASTIDSPPAVQAIQWVHDLMYQAQVQPTPADKVGGTPFRKGLVAMELGLSGFITQIRAAKASFDWDVMHIPRGKVHVTRTASAGYSIARATRHPQEAWLALSQGLTSEAAFARWAKAGLWITPNKAVANSPTYRDASLPPQHFQVIVDALSYARGEPITRNWLAVGKAMDAGLAPVWQNKTSVTAAVAQIKQQVDAILAKV